MTMRNPAVAVLWESWRLSRFSLLTLTFCSIVGGAVLLIALGTEGATPTLFLAGFVALVLTGNWTIKLRRGLGFPMTQGFARPIATWVLVTVPMVYVGVSAAIVFLIPLIVLNAAFEISFPLFPTAVLILAAKLVLVASHWWTGSAVIGITSWMIVYLFTARQFFDTYASQNDFSNRNWAEIVTFPPATLVMTALVAVGSVALTIFGVARQRRGDNGFGPVSRATAGAAPTRRFVVVSRLSDRLRLPCPVSSPTAAQLWYETRTGGGRVLGRGILSVMGFTLVVLSASAIDPSGEETAGYFYANVALIVGMIVPLIAGVRSLLGVSRRQGMTYVSAFDATRPIGTGQLISLKVAVTAFAILLSWVAMGIAFWVLPTDFMGLGTKPDNALQLVLAAPLDLAILVLIPPIFALTLIAYSGAFHALFLRNPRPVIVSSQVFGIYLVGMVYAFATNRVTDSAIQVQLVVITAAVALATLYLWRRALKERILGTGGFTAVLALGSVVTTGAVGMGIVFPDGWGGPGGEVTAASLATVTLVVLLPLLAMVLAPWSFSRIRHR